MNFINCYVIKYILLITENDENSVNSFRGLSCDFNNNIIIYVIDQGYIFNLELQYINKNNKQVDIEEKYIRAIKEKHLKFIKQTRCKWINKFHDVFPDILFKDLNEIIFEYLIYTDY